MSRAQEIRDAQEQLEREMEEDMAQRQEEAPRPPAAPVNSADFCATSRDGHEFTMKGRDGVRRCWYCCRTRAQVYGT